MIPLSCLAAIVLAGATPSAASPAPGDSETSAQDQARFDLLKKRFLQQQGIPASAAGGAAAVPAPGSPAVLNPTQPPSWQEQERERSTQFNAQFGAGSYEGIIGFSKRCVSADGCDKLATADVISGAYQFVDLQKDVEKKTLTVDSSAYRSRHEEIKGGMRVAMEEFRPHPGARSSYEADFIKFSDPIVKKIFSKEDLLQYAQRNAASSDSAPFYTYLGQTLNAAGPPDKARAAFDAALQRDPKNEAALSGRAEARLNMGDYSGAVRDAGAALKLDPEDRRALATLKFSEGRAPAGAAAGLAGGPSEGGAGAGPGGFGSPGGSGQAAPGRADGIVPFDALRRSESLVAEARHRMGVGDSQAAADLLAKAVELNPRNAEALSLAAMADIRLKNYPAALAAAEAGLKLAPNNSALLDAKANALNYMKDYRGALAAADLALAADPRDAMAHFNRAWALGGLHDREGALASLKSAAEFNPQFAPALASALMLPPESDIIFLFPGAKAGASSDPAAAAPGAAWPSWLILAGGLTAGIIGLLLIARLRRRSAPPLRRA
jgi:tetratricopeptide (TPR) repeat protein